MWFKECAVVESGDTIHHVLRGWFSGQFPVPSPNAVAVQGADGVHIS